MLNKIETQHHPALDAPSTTAGVTLRVHRQLLCPRCDRAIRSFDTHELIDGSVALTCAGCHVVVVQIDVEDASS